MRLAQVIRDLDVLADHLARRYSISREQAVAEAAGIIKSANDVRQVQRRVRRQNRELHDLDELDELY